MTKDPRKPQSFSIEEPPVAEIRMRKPGAFDAGVTIVPDELDPFLGAPATEDLPLPPAPGRRGPPLLKIFLAALGTILSVAFGLWLDGLIRNLFTRADWLGYAAIGVTTLGMLALLGMAGREWLGMRRLSAVQALKHQRRVQLPHGRNAIQHHHLNMACRVGGLRRGRRRGRVTHHVRQPHLDGTEQDVPVIDGNLKMKLVRRVVPSRMRHGWQFRCGMIRPGQKVQVHKTKRFQGFVREIPRFFRVQVGC